MRVFNDEQFHLFSDIIFNIFPQINFVVLNGNNNYFSLSYLQCYKNEPIFDTTKSDEYELCYEEDKESLFTHIPLRKIGFNKLDIDASKWLIKRTAKTKPYTLNYSNLPLKLFPLMEFCCFSDVEYNIRRNALIFFGGMTEFYMYLDTNVNVDNIRHSVNIEAIRIMTKLILKGE